MTGSLLFIADHDDPDVQRATCALEDAGKHPTWFRLGLAHEHYDIDASLKSVCVTCDGVALDAEAVSNASRCVFRRWKVAPPAPVVVAKIAGDEFGFAEREWAAAVEFVLDELWRPHADSDRWSRPPMVRLEKLGLVRDLERLGAPVPEFRVRNNHDRPAGPVVSKGIATDQSVRPGARYPTTTVSLPTMDYLFDRRQPCPVMLQSEIEVVTELRIGYCFGHSAAVAQHRLDHDDDTTDLRYVSVRREVVPVPPEVSSIAGSFAAASGINAFTLDVLTDGAGNSWIIDVNPDGLFLAADSESHALSEVFLRGLESPRR